MKKVELGSCIEFIEDISDNEFIKKGTKGVVCDILNDGFVLVETDRDDNLITCVHVNKLKLLEC